MAINANGHRLAARDSCRAAVGRRRTGFRSSAEIATGPPTFVQPASNAEIVVAKTPVGKSLVSEWGSWAPEKVADDQAAGRTDDGADERGCCG